MDDPFEQISNLNLDSYNCGFKEGIINGKKIALAEGFKAGIQVSFKIAKEIGNVHGTCSIYKNQQIDGSNEKISKLAIQICELIEQFDLKNCQSDDFESNINHIKDKFKQFCSLIKTKNFSLTTNQSHLTF